jgi:hypothetical protein
MSLLKGVYFVTAAAFILVSVVECDDSCWTADPSENQFKCQRRCQTNFEYMNGNCYYFPNTNDTTGKKLFVDAEKFCQQRGGHLASVHSSGEDMYIASMSWDMFLISIHIHSTLLLLYRALSINHSTERISVYACMIL